MKRNQQLIKAFPHSDDILKGLNPDVAMIRYSSQNTPEKCIKGSTVKLVEIKKIYNVETSVLLVEAMVINLNSSLNVYVKMNEHQVREAAVFIYEDFYYLNIAELTLIFKRIKKGTLGRIQNRLDCNIILQAFIEYRTERMKAFQEIEKEQRNESYTPVDYGKYNQRVKTIMDKKKVNKKKKAK